MKKSEILDKIIIGRVDPHIYAFTTNTVPNYLKVGDTYRPVTVRLKEWENHYPNLEKKFESKALINEEVFFRDYSIHQFLENELKKDRLKANELPNVYYSNEFFKNVEVKDIETAIQDIKKDFEENLGKYQFYDAKTLLPEIYKYESMGNLKLRPNQEEVVKNYIKAVDNGRTNLLMYAVMRFGKSFTALSCATAKNSKIVVVVSAKADVSEEWKKTVESVENFSDYEYINSELLSSDSNIIMNTLKNKKGCVIFLTLQDLNGEILKEKHKQLFEVDIDLLIIDETHFGVRAEKYGQVLKSNKYEKDIKDKRPNDFEDINNAINKINKFLTAKVKLHLSGTPYRILMGSEFDKEDIICFCQFSDIMEEKDKWDCNYLSEEQYNEWDNPYYGFPQMIRFAFNPNESTLNKLKELKKNGYSFAFSELFKPKSIKRSNNNDHKIFVNQKEILDLLEVIDGSKKDNNLLGFLDYKKIKEGKMCRHIVCVLPYRASCDSLESLIAKNKKKFKNLGDYEIVNISGVDKPDLYKNTKDVIAKIKDCENNSKKTITLTVNRMLTGSTVEQWDTMLYFKDTASPQEYDQSIFRLQNQFIKKYENGEGEVIKYNMKPQTILVDFDPERMFYLQEHKALIYNVNTEDGGNERLKERIQNELKISPIITINNDKIKEVKADDIMKAVSNYSKNRGVMEETNEIPVDLLLLKNESIRKVILSQPELGSKQGLSTGLYDGDGDYLDVDGDYLDVDGDMDNKIEQLGFSEISWNTQSEEGIDKTNPAKQFRTYYARILFYSYLTSDNVISLKDIINTIDKDDNLRISRNLGLDKHILELIRKNMDVLKLNQLDYKIHNINALSDDSTVTPIERVSIAINKFSKISESEIITPAFIAKDMVNLISDKDLKANVSGDSKILDIASKIGEFSFVLYEKLVNNLNIDKNIVNNLIYSIPTSSIAYEFTRKVYETLGLNIDNIASRFTSYDLIKIKNNNELDIEMIEKYLLQNKKFSEIELEDNFFSKEGSESVKFDVIIGNPPYQSMTKKLLYPDFYLIAKEISKSTVLIFPNSWQLPKNNNGLEKLNKSEIKEDHQIVHIDNRHNVFPGVAGAEWTNIVWWEKNYNNGLDGKQNIMTEGKNLKFEKLPLDKSELRKPMEIKELANIVMGINGFVSIKKVTTARKPYGLPTDFLKKCNKNDFVKIKKTKEKSDDIKIYISTTKMVYVDSDFKFPRKAPAFKKYKVFIPDAWGNMSNTGLGGAFSDIIVSSPNEATLGTYIESGCFDDKESAKKHAKYFMTKFFRALLYANKHSIINSTAWESIPVQHYNEEFWNGSISEIDDALFEKYKIPDNIRQFVYSNIQTKSEINIINY